MVFFLILLNNHCCFNILLILDISSGARAFILDISSTNFCKPPDPQQIFRDTVTI